MVGACSSSVASSTKSEPRRVVRVTDAFFEQLDDVLGIDRGPNGEPSASDFIVLELPPIVDRFATDFEGLPDEVAPLGLPLTALLDTTVLTKARCVPAIQHELAAEIPSATGADEGSRTPVFSLGS